MTSATRIALVESISRLLFVLLPAGTVVRLRESNFLSFEERIEVR
jgi:hypothetical protein